MSTEKDKDQEILDTNMNRPEQGDEGFELPSAALCPHIESPEIVIQFMKNTYGLTVLQLKPQNGYDDRNYHVLAASEHSNPYIGEVSHLGYFLKISSHRDSQNPEFLHAQLTVMEHLVQKGILCQSPIRSIIGDAITECTAANKDGVNVTYLVSLRTYLPGVIIGDVHLTPKLLFNVGHYVASITKALQDFHHPFYERFDCFWSMNNIPTVKKALYAVKDDKMRKICGEVIQAFISDIVPNKCNFRKGQIHGDVNEQNILVTVESSPDKTPQICGLLDFQDSAISFPIYDLAMATCYMLMAKFSDVPIVDAPGHILAGYTSLLEISPAEKVAFKTLVAGRMVQSLAMGAYTFYLDPANQYVLTTAQCGWKALETLWEADDVQMHQRWDLIVKSYK